MPFNLTYSWFICIFPTEEQKLAKDRTFIVVGIISAILLLIGIFVISYFLAK